jgi:hypothetical protein
MSNLKYFYLPDFVLSLFVFNKDDIKPFTNIEYKQNLFTLCNLRHFNQHSYFVSIYCCFLTKIVLTNLVHGWQKCNVTIFIGNFTGKDYKRFFVTSRGGGGGVREEGRREMTPNVGKKCHLLFE